MNKLEKLVIDDILKWEGGYSDNPADSGKITNFGITSKTFHEWQKHDPFAPALNSVKDLTKDQAYLFYSWYFNKYRINKLISFPLLFWFMSDSVVQHGAYPIYWLQKTVGTVPDGIIGPKTVSCVQKAGEQDVYFRLIAERIQFYGQIVSKNHSQAIFTRGWLRRVTRFILLDYPTRRVICQS